MLTILRTAAANSRPALAFWKRMTLAWVNVQRVKHAKPRLLAMPVGEWADAKRCPIAVATGQPSYAIPMPWFVGEFVRAYDEKRYPELLRGESRKVTVWATPPMRAEACTPASAAEEREAFLREYDERRAQRDLELV